ncbi:MAG TPA: PHB depolymerase family esterase [Myxococcales bacterium]|nr:PHB depolymerase family esterase [Myxococcales bacterium]
MILLVAALLAAPVERTIATPDGERRYLLVKPAATGPLPLVVVLHGHGGNARLALTRSPLAAWAIISARDGVLVAAPVGTRGPDGRQGWNDCRDAPRQLPHSDDVGFVRAVIDALVRDDGADPSRVYVMGMSNGAMMALRLAVQLDPPPAAVAAACGLLADGGQCAPPARPIPALLIEGTKDPLVSWEGGALGKNRGVVLSATRTAEAFVAAAGLAGAKPVETAFPHREKSDPTRAVKQVWGPAGGPQVELIRIEGGGHAEPTLDHPYGFAYRLLTGKQNHDFESAEEAWSFFRTRRAAAASGSRSSP